MTPEERARTVMEAWADEDDIFLNFDRFERLIAEAVSDAVAEARRWIPVEEKPVPREGEYLFLGEAGAVSVDCVDSDGKAFIYDYGAMESVTHWMPIPELPQKGVKDVRTKTE